jgi:hypothetical protein
MPVKTTVFSAGHAFRVTSLTRAGKRKTRRNLLLLALPGGRVMGSIDRTARVARH